MAEFPFREFVPAKLTLWERVRLWFVRPEYSFDCGDGDYTVETTFKRLDGKIIITEIDVKNLRPAPGSASEGGKDGSR